MDSSREKDPVSSLISAIIADPAIVAPEVHDVVKEAERRIRVQRTVAVIALVLAALLPVAYIASTSSSTSPVRTAAESDPVAPATQGDDGSTPAAANDSPPVAFDQTLANWVGQYSQRHPQTVRTHAPQFSDEGALVMVMFAFPQSDGTNQFVINFATVCGSLSQGRLYLENAESAWYGEGDRHDEGRAILQTSPGTNCEPEEPAQLSRLLESSFEVSLSGDDIVFSNAASELTFTALPE